MNIKIILTNTSDPKLEGAVILSRDINDKNCTHSLEKDIYDITCDYLKTEVNESGEVCLVFNGHLSDEEAFKCEIQGNGGDNGA